MPGHPHPLTAAGTVKMPMLTVFTPAEQIQILPVFLIPFVSIPGKTAKNRPEHKNIRKHSQKKIQKRQPNKHGKQAGRHTHPQNCRIQLVRSVPTFHEPAKTRGQTAEKTSHTITLYPFIVFHYYIRLPPVCNQKTVLFTECLRILFPS